MSLALNGADVHIVEDGPSTEGAVGKDGPPAAL